jgi:hypothetical protein
MVGALLFRQGSNLDSSDSESDVLPVTPRNNNRCKSIKVFSKTVCFLQKYS